MRTSLDGGRAPSSGRPRPGTGGVPRSRAAAALLATALLLATGAGCASQTGAVGGGQAAGRGTQPVVTASGRASDLTSSSPSSSSADSGPGPRHRHPSGPPPGGGPGGPGNPGGPGGSGSGSGPSFGQGGGSVQGGGLDATAQRLAPYLQRHFGAAYAAVLIDDPHDQLVIYRLPDPRLDAVARAMAGRTRVAFVTARYSFQRQLQVLARIAHDLGYWRGRGVVINSRGTTNGVHCAVIVATSTGGPQQQRAFDARYGAGVVKVVEGDAIVSK
jgi:hypothetical protein